MGASSGASLAAGWRTVRLRKYKEEAAGPRVLQPLTFLIHLPSLLPAGSDERLCDSRWVNRAAAVHRNCRQCLVKQLSTVGSW